jgi:XTP/dITP diphosphohydrolase
VNVYFVTGNRNKYMEARFVLSKFGINVIQSTLVKLEIQSDDLREIVRYALDNLPPSQDWLVVEDDGLFIEALGGFPGPYSSYVYRTIGPGGILKLMQGEENRVAVFRSVVGFRAPNGDAGILEGTVVGRISSEIRGSGGFGFDPIFIPEGYEATFAELTMEEKCRISHRARAFEELGRLIRNK